MVQAQKTRKNSMLGSMCLHSPGVSASWKNRAYISYWLEILPVLKTKLPSSFLFIFTPWPIVSLQVNLGWHLLCRALMQLWKRWATLFVRLGPFMGNPSLLSKWCCSVSYLHTPKLREKRSNFAPFLLSLSSVAHKPWVGEKFKHRITDCFPVSTSTEQV